MSWTAYVSSLGFYLKKKKSCARWLEMFAAYSFTVLEDGSSRFVHDSYEGSRRNVFLIFLAPGDSKCSWDCGSITIVTSCFLWSILSHMLLRNCLRWSNYKEVLWFFSLFKTWIHLSEWLVSIFVTNQGKDRLVTQKEKNALKLLAGFSNGCRPGLLQGMLFRVTLKDVVFIEKCLCSSH